MIHFWGFGRLNLKFTGPHLMCFRFLSIGYLKKKDWCRLSNYLKYNGLALAPRTFTIYEYVLWSNLLRNIDAISSISSILCANALHVVQLWPVSYTIRTAKFGPQLIHNSKYQTAMNMLWIKWFNTFSSFKGKLLQHFPNKSNQASSFFRGVVFTLRDPLWPSTWAYSSSHNHDMS